jgi:hypothetical protein
MTTQPWRPPAASTADWRRDTDERERFVEDMLQLGSNDRADNEIAMRRLRLLTGLCDVELRTRVDELLSLAEQIADLEREIGRYTAWRAYCDDYEAALHRFAHPTLPVDDPMAIADVLQEPARPAPLRVVSGGGQS